MNPDALRRLGVFLIHAGVILRCLYRLPRLEHPAWVVTLLALNAALLILESLLAPSQQASPRRLAPPGAAMLPDWLWHPMYLLLQAAIVLALLFNRPLMDFCALLFIPISMSAVLFYGRRIGFVWIAAFTAAMAVPLVMLQTNKSAGAVMALTYGGLSFLLGGYAHQVRQAEAAHSETQRTLAELQVAHVRLQAAAVEREELAAEHERNRLARELHDSVTQTVFSMNLTVQAARLLLPRDTARTTAQFLRLEALAANALREIQVLVSSLRPSPAGPADLPAALRREAASGAFCLPLQGAPEGGEMLKVSVEVMGNRTLPEPVAAGLYAIAQEALTNTARHAGVREASVRLNLEEPGAFLEVEDCGCGFVPQAVTGARGHLGLAGMAERAKDLGWRLVVDSRPGLGTRIRVEECQGQETQREAPRGTRA